MSDTRDLRQRRLNLRLNESEYGLIHKAAAAFGVADGTYARAVLVEAAKNHIATGRRMLEEAYAAIADC